MRFILFIAILIATRANTQTTWPGKDWPTTSPKEVGFNADSLAALDAILASDKYGHIDGMLVIRHGKVAYSKVYNHDYKKIYGGFINKAGDLKSQAVSVLIDALKP